MKRRLLNLPILAVAATLAGCDPVNNPGGFTTMMTVIAIFTVLVTTLPFFFIFKRLRAKQKVLTTGLKAKGKILAASPTGVSINSQPQLSITLEIKPPGDRPAYTAEARQVVSPVHMYMLQPGTEVPIRVDRNNHANVAIDFAGGMAGAMQAAQAQAQAGQPPAATPAPQQLVQCTYCQVPYVAGQPKCPNCGAPTPM